MDETTDKSPSPADATDDAKPTDAPLDDKDLGQETPDTGAPKDDSESNDDAPSDDSEADTEEEADEDETTSEDEGSEAEEDEPTLLTPEEIKKLPPELKAQYASMNTQFQSKMKVVNDLVAKAREIIDNGGRPTEGAGDNPAAPSVVDTVLQRRGIDPTKLSKDVRETLDLVAEVAQEAGGAKANEAVAPLQAKEVKQQVDGYFAKSPERAKFRKAMAELDRKTGETMTLDELFYAVSGKTRETADAVRKDKKLRELAGRNSESASGTPGGSKEDGDIFDDIAKAGGHDNSILL